VLEEKAGGMDYAAVAMAVNRFDRKLSRNQQTRKPVAEIDKIINVRM
jgi:hypothetical protein